MEQAIATILSGDVDSKSLLLLFIVGLLTKRFVPWWVHEDALKKLQKYEELSPSLIDSIDELVSILNEEDDMSDQPIDKVLRTKEELKNAVSARKRPTSRQRKRTR